MRRGLNRYAKELGFTLIRNGGFNHLGRQLWPFYCILDAFARACARLDLLKYLPPFGYFSFFDTQARFKSPLTAILKSYRFMEAFEWGIWSQPVSESISRLVTCLVGKTARLGVLMVLDIKIACVCVSVSVWVGGGGVSLPEGTGGWEESS